MWTCRFKSTELRETEVLQAGLSTDRIVSFVKVICRLAGPGLGGRVDWNRQSFVRLKSRKTDSTRPSLSCRVDWGMCVFVTFLCISHACGVDFVGPGAPLASFWVLGAPKPIRDLIFSFFFRGLDKFRAALGAQRAPTGPQGAHSRPK